MKAIKLNSTAIKLCLSLSLVTFAGTGLAISRDLYSILIFLGMLFCFHGDLTLAGIGPFEKLYKNSFLIGIASFAIGHSFYTTAFISIYSNLLWSLCVLSLYILTLFLLAYIFIYNANTPKLLHNASLLYGLIIAFMATAAFTVFWGLKRFWILPAIGGFIFIISDFLIGTSELGKKKVPHYQKLVWITYMVAQLLIIISGILKD